MEKKNKNKTGKKNCNKHGNGQNSKSKAQPSNSKTKNVAETAEKKKQQQNLIKIDANTPKSPQPVATCKTLFEFFEDCGLEKTFNDMYNRVKFDAIAAMVSIKSYVHFGDDCYDDDLRRAANELINKKLKIKLVETQKKYPSIDPSNCLRFHIDRNGLAFLINRNLENLPIASTSTSVPSTSADMAIPSTSKSSIEIKADEESLKQVLDILRSQKIELLDEITKLSSVPAIRAKTVPVDRDSPGQSDWQSYDENNVLLWNESFDTVHDDFPRGFHCLHCQFKTGNQNKFDTLKQVYNHWQQEHCSEIQTLPFYFYTTEFGNCSYCDDVGTYWDLLKHHTVKHPKLPVAITDIINDRKCALCSYIGENVPLHSEMHRHYIKNFNSRQITRMTNPLLYTDETYDERLQLRIHQKHLCLECDLAFDTASSQRQHSLYKHRQPSGVYTKCNSKAFFDTSRHMICGCCCARIPWNKLLEHLSSVKLEFSCHTCSFTFYDTVDLIIHDRTDHNIENSTFVRMAQLSNRLKKYYQSTRIIHGNGLVITMQNILGTVHDDWRKFSCYIDELLKTIIARLTDIKFYEKNGEYSKKGNKMTQTDNENKKIPKYLGDRILCENAVGRLPIQPKKKAKPNNKTKAISKTDHRPSVNTCYTQTGHLTTRV